MAIALSLDGLAVGFSASMSKGDGIQLVLLSFVTDAVTVMGGW